MMVLLSSCNDRLRVLLYHHLAYFWSRFHFRWGLYKVVLLIMCGERLSVSPTTAVYTCVWYAKYFVSFFLSLDGRVLPPPQKVCMYVPIGFCPPCIPVLCSTSSTNHFTNPTSIRSYHSFAVCALASQPLVLETIPRTLSKRLSPGGTSYAPPTPPAKQFSGACGPREARKKTVDACARCIYVCSCMVECSISGGSYPLNVEIGKRQKQTNVSRFKMCFSFLFCSSPTKCSRK